MLNKQDLNVSAKYLVKSNFYSNKEHQKVLDLLYGPIIGADALNLYRRLLAEFEYEKHTDLKEFNNHYVLLEALGITKLQFVHARQKLESLGLIKTQYDIVTDKELYIFILNEPYSAVKFNGEPLLKNLLMRQVGIEQYKKLLAMFIPKDSFAEIKGQDISASFWEVYSKEEAELSYENVLFEKKEDAAIKIDQKRLDFELINAIIATSKITYNQAEIKNKEEYLQKLALAYQLNEEDLAKLLITAFSQNDKLETIKLEVLTNDLYTQKNVQKSLAKQTEQKSPDIVKTTAKQKALLTEENQSESAEEQLVALLSLPSIKLLTKLKDNPDEELYILNNEISLLDELKQKMSLELLNFLIYYVLVIQNKGSLNAEYCKSIANDWLKKGYQSYVDVIRAFSSKKPAKPKYNNNYDKNRSNPNLPTMSYIDNQMTDEQKADEIIRLSEKAAKEREKRRLARKKHKGI